MENIFISAYAILIKQYTTLHCFLTLIYLIQNHTLALYHYTNQETYERYIYHPEKKSVGTSFDKHYNVSMIKRDIIFSLYCINSLRNVRMIVQLIQHFTEN